MLSRPFKIAFVSSIAALFAGCAAPHPAIKMSELKPGSTQEEQAIAANPLAYLRASEQRAAALDEYQLTFVRQERLGLVPSLRPPERMETNFRRQPFSVKFTWPDPKAEYDQCVFIAGQNDDKVILLPRAGFLGLPAKPAAWDPMDGVRFWKTRNPITDFGVHRIVVRTLNRIDDAQKWGGATVKYLGQRTIENTLVRHFEMKYPADDEFPNKRQDFFVEVASGIPFGTNLWLPGGELDATYLYLNRRVPDHPLTDADFQITPAAPKTKSS